MKIISGNLKGRTIKEYQIEGTRPTMDRVKESLFAIIQNKVSNSIVVDLFAGSGNLGIEAISNGSKHCYFNDINRECVKAISKTIQNFDISNFATVLNKNWLECLKYLKSIDIKLDLVFLDPPYKMECLNEVIEKIVEYDLLNKEALVVCEISHNYLKFRFIFK